MPTPPASIPDLYKTAGQRYALRDLGLISQEEFEKDAWVTAALAAAPMVWGGIKWLGKKMFGGAKNIAQRGGQMMQQGGQQMLQRGRQVAQGMRPPV
jgi:hypothetical protein